MRGERFGDIDVTVEQTPPSNSTHGYAPYRFLISNRSPQADRRVTLWLPREGYRGRIERIERTVEVGAGQSVRCSLWAPPLETYGDGIGVAIDGRVQRSNLSPPIHTTGGYWSDEYHLLIPHRIEAFDILGAPIRLNASTQIVVHRNEGGGVSSHWLDYSPYHVVLVSAEWLRSMPGEGRQALMRYAECGGCLAVLGRWKPEDLQGIREPLNAYGAIVKYPAGFGSIVVFESSRRKRFVLDDGLLAHLSKHFTGMRGLKADSNDYFPFRRRRPIDQSDFPVIEDTQPPVQYLFLFMIAFVLLIGPANLIFLCRTDRRLWLLWTVPAMSVLASGTIFAIGILDEGVHTRTRIAAVTILDQRTARAATLGRLGYYSPFPPRGGLHFDYGTEVTPIDFDLGPVTIDWTHDQHFESGWFASRVPLQLRVRRSETRRERITVSVNESGDTLAVNGLGVSVKRLIYADGKGELWRAEAIAAGDEVKLTPLGRIASATPFVFHDLLTNAEWRRAPENLTERPERFLRPNAWIAVLDDSPFLDEGIGEVSDRKVEAVVYGILDTSKGEAN